MDRGGRVYFFGRAFVFDLAYHWTYDMRMRYTTPFACWPLRFIKTAVGKRAISQVIFNKRELQLI